MLAGQGLQGLSSRPYALVAVPKPAAALHFRASKPDGLELLIDTRYIPHPGVSTASEQEHATVNSLYHTQSGLTSMIPAANTANATCTL